MDMLIYLLKVSACTVLFFGFYLLILRKLTFFKLNRFYLLSTLLLSLVIPALQINWVKTIEQANVKSSFEVQDTRPLQVEIQPLPPPVYQQVDIQHPFNWFILAAIVYGTVVLCMLSFCVWKLIKLFNHTRGYTSTLEGLKIVPKPSGFTNCSFFNYVFIDEESMSATDLDVLLTHEQVHARQLHSVDKIVLMLVKAVLWFNPIVYLYDRAIEQNHEYEADEITSSNFSRQAYANLLLRLAITKSDMPLIHNFVKSPIKARIKMLFNSKSKSMKKLSYLLTLPVVAGLVWVFGIQVVYAQKHDIAQEMKEAVEVAASQVEPTKTNFTSTEYHQKEAQRKKVNKKIINGSIKAPAFLNEERKVTFTEKQEIPKIISYRSLTGNIKTEITYLTDAVIEIQKGTLKAKHVIWDKKNNILIANVGCLYTQDYPIFSERFCLDLKNGTFEIESPQGEALTKALNANDNQPEILTKNARPNISYKATDSIKLSKDKSVISMFGKAELLYNDIKITGSKIIYNSNDQAVGVNNARLLSGYRNRIKADSIYMNLETKKIKTFGKLEEL